jgi:hypothetical protein
MCDNNNTLTLCTCAPGEELDESIEILWHLYRLSTYKPKTSKYGLVGLFISKYHFREENIGQIIAGHLNYRNCFDFEYFPKKDDYLNIKGHINNTKVDIDFVFNGTEWRVTSPKRNTRILKIRKRKFNYGKVL